ncbi:hypothetical protein C8Q79DRAFT_14659 [Trametes meyenii]|nr:hypothetical protein C8Q79DRAFT_14659 [Trametes meyenii]
MIVEPLHRRDCLQENQNQSLFSSQVQASSWGRFGRRTAARPSPGIHPALSPDGGSRYYSLRLRPWRASRYKLIHGIFKFDVQALDLLELKVISRTTDVDDDGRGCSTCSNLFRARSCEGFSVSKLQSYKASPCTNDVRCATQWSRRSISNIQYPMLKFNGQTSIASAGPAGSPCTGCSYRSSSPVPFLRSADHQWARRPFRPGATSGLRHSTREADSELHSSTFENRRKSFWQLQLED